MFKMGIAYAGFVALIGGCTAKDPEQGRAGIDTSSGGPLIAFVRTAESGKSVVFGPISEAPRMVEAVVDEPPHDFHWVGLVFGNEFAGRLDTPEGVRIDLSVPADFRFKQVYRDVCNPAAENFNPCWLYENYRAGDPGLSGYVHARLSAGTAWGDWEVTWEGITDRFEGQPQWHRHGSSGNAAAAIGQEEQQ